MTNKRFLIRYTPCRHIHQIVHNAVLKSKQEIEITQSRIGVNEHNALAAHSKSDTDIGSRRRLADASFTRCHHIDLTHMLSYLSIGSITI